jgi:hypothetical protein
MHLSCLLLSAYLVFESPLTGFAEESGKKEEEEGEKSNR